MVSVSSSILPLAAIAAVAVAGPAPISTDSPTNIIYKATFDKGGITGFVSFSSTNGSVLVDVNLANLPNYGGPFLYHVHQKPVPTDGNCYGTLDHLNPYNGSMTATSPAYMEVGDLSGKHGAIPSTSYTTSYIDQYLSLNPANPAYLGGLSVVVHLNNLTRIGCANITLYSVITNAAPSLLAGVGLPLAAGAAALLL